MTLAGVDYDVRKGWFDQTVPEYAAERPTVAIVHLDGDWYESILTCLEHLYPIVSPGGLILIDDYGLWDGCTRAVHHYLARTEAAEDLRRSDSGVTFLRKR
jgi:O-methyltransferase